MKRPIDEQAMQEASQALWGGDAEPVSGEKLAEAAEAMFGAAPTEPTPAPREDPDDWAHTLFG